MKVIVRTIAAGAIVLGLGLAGVGVAAGGGSAGADVRADPDAAGSSAAASRTNPAHKTAKRAKLTLIDSPFGEMLADRNGHALYLFTRDKPDRSRCRGACADSWPPLKTKRKPKVGAGLDKDLLGTTKRRGGAKQVTYNGQPVYFYIDDRKPEQVRCQDVREFGGTWLVVSPEGEPIR